EVAVLAVSHKLRDLRLIPIALRHLGRRTALGGAQGSGMEEQEIEDQTGIHGHGPPVAEGAELLFDEVVEQEAAAPQALVEVESEVASRGSLDLFPHPGQQDLKDRGDGGGALPDQVAGDPRRKLGGDLKAVLPLQAVARRWAEDGFLDAVAVEVGDL